MIKRTSIYNNKNQLELNLPQDCIGIKPCFLPVDAKTIHSVSLTASTESIQGSSPVPVNSAVNTTVQIKQPDLLKLVHQWKTENKNDRATNYASAVLEIFKEANYDPSNLTDTNIESAYTKNKWSERHIWPVTALFKFLCWCHKRNLLSVNRRWIWEYIRQENKCPAQIDEEIEKIFAGYTIGQKGKKSSPADIKKKKTLVGCMRLFIILEHPDRNINSLTDFTTADALEIQNYVEENKISILTFDTAAPSHWSGQLCILESIFILASRKIDSVQNIFEKGNPKKIKSTARDRFFSIEEMAKLTTVNTDGSNKLNPYELFELYLPVHIIEVGYEGALRAEDLRDLCWEDKDAIYELEEHIGALPIRHGKDREEKEVDYIPVCVQKLKPVFDHLKKIEDDYCRDTGITPPVMVEHGVVLHPIFFKKNGKQLTTTDITNIVKRRCQQVNVHLNPGEASHVVFRHTKLTHLGMRGMPSKLLMVKSRHKDIETLMIYDHSGLIAAASWMEEDYMKEEAQKSKNNNSLIGAQFPEPEKCYTLNELQLKWNTIKKQCWWRIKALKKAGHIRTSKNKSGELIIPKEEIDKFDNEFIEIAKAAIIAECPSEELRQARRNNMINAIKIGKLWFLNRAAFTDWLYERNLKKEKNAKIT